MVSLNNSAIFLDKRIRPKRTMQPFILHSLGGLNNEIPVGNLVCYRACVCSGRGLLCMEICMNAIRWRIS